MQIKLNTGAAKAKKQEKKQKTFQSLKLKTL